MEKVKGEPRNITGEIAVQSSQHLGLGNREEVGIVRF